MVINTNSGEASLMLMFFWDSFLSRRGISSKEEYVVICTKRYLVDMVKFYFPEVRAVQYNSGFMKSRVAFEDAGQWRIHWLFPSTYFRNLFTGALPERLDNKKLVFELNEGSLNLRIF